MGDAEPALAPDADPVAAAIAAAREAVQDFDDAHLYADEVQGVVDALTAALARLEDLCPAYEFYELSGLIEDLELVHDALEQAENNNPTRELDDLEAWLADEAAEAEAEAWAKATAAAEHAAQDDTTEA